MVTKECIDCHEPKPLTEFYRNSHMADGHLNNCKVCKAKKVRANYQNNREHYREYERRRAMLPDRVAMRKRYESTPEGKLALARANKAYDKKYPDKYKAHCAVSNAIRDGKIERPDHCERCNDDCVPHAHHHDYSKLLDVEWLCISCHQEEHRPCPPQ